MNAATDLMQPLATLPPAPSDPYEACWTVVLARTPRGDDEVSRHLMPLTRAQRSLLLATDGELSLKQVVAQQPELRTARLSREAARLLAFGLVKQVRGELPRQLIVEAMNLTIRVPLSTFTPREAQGAPVHPAPAPHPTPRRETGAWPVQAIALAAVFALAAIWLTNA
jgi:hypothetical protein